MRIELYRHNDLPWQMYKNEQNVLANIDLYTDMRLRWPISHTDIPRLRTGKVGGQVSKQLFFILCLNVIRLGCNMQLL